MNKNIKVALLAIGVLIAFVLIYQFMKGSLFHATDPTYKAYYTNVSDLKVSNKVYLQGVAVGYIQDIAFQDMAHPDKVSVSMVIDKSLKIPQNSTVEIVSISLMGNKGLKLNMGDSKQYAQNGAILEGKNEKGMFEALSSNIEPLADNTSALMANVNTLFDRRQDENLYLTLDHLNKSLAQMQTLMLSMNTLVLNNQKSINGTLANVDKITGAVAKKHNDIEQIVSNSKDLTGQLKNADLKKSFDNLNQSITQLNQMMTEVNKGKGSMGKLMKDEELYNKLVSTTNSADELLKDMKANPKRYVSFSVFGGKK